MTQLRRIGGSAVLALVLALALTTPARAGGWAVVTLDALPSGPQARQTLSLGFMVRQHGVTPIDGLGQGTTMTPVLTARNIATGETLRADARKAGPVGHFVVEVAFPTAGAWQWQIAPPPFAATDLGTLSVAPAAAAPAQGVWPPTLALSASSVRDGLRWLGATLLLIAGLLGLRGWRATLAHRRPGRVS